MRLKIASEIVFVHFVVYTLTTNVDYYSSVRNLVMMIVFFLANDHIMAKFRADN